MAAFFTLVASLSPGSLNTPLTLPQPLDVLLVVTSGASLVTHFATSFLLFLSFGSYLLQISYPADCAVLYYLAPGTQQSIGTYLSFLNIFSAWWLSKYALCSYCYSTPYSWQCNVYSFSVFVSRVHPSRGLGSMSSSLSTTLMVFW